MNVLTAIDCWPFAEEIRQCHVCGTRDLRDDIWWQSWFIHLASSDLLGSHFACSIIAVHWTSAVFPTVLEQAVQAVTFYEIAASINGKRLEAIWREALEQLRLRDARRCVELFSGETSAIVCFNVTLLGDHCGDNSLRSLDRCELDLPSLLCREITFAEMQLLRVPIKTMAPLEFVKLCGFFSPNFSKPLNDVTN